MSCTSLNGKIARRETIVRNTTAYIKRRVLIDSINSSPKPNLFSDAKMKLCSTKSNAYLPQIVPHQYFLVQCDTVCHLSNELTHQ